MSPVVVVFVLLVFYVSLPSLVDIEHAKCECMNEYEREWIVFLLTINYYRYRLCEYKSLEH